MGAQASGAIVNSLNKMYGGIKVEKAVIDRIEEKLAVVLVGDEEKEFHVDVAHLPSNTKEGSHLTVTVAEGRLVDIQLDEEATLSAADRIQKKMEMLRKKSKK